MVPISNMLEKMKVCSLWWNGRPRGVGLMMHFFLCILILNTCLVHIQSCLFVSRWCALSSVLVCIGRTQSPLASMSAGSASSHPHASVFAILTSPFVSASLESAYLCSHACSFAVLRPPFVSSSLDSAYIHPPPSVFAVVRSHFVPSSLESACLLSSLSVFAILRSPFVSL